MPPASVPDKREYRDVERPRPGMGAAPPRDVRSWEAFLVTAAKRKALDRVRSADVRHAGPEFVESIHDRADDTDLAEDVADAIDRKERAALAWDCLSVLDERHRKAVWETVAMERPRSEVAAALGKHSALIVGMLDRRSAGWRPVAGG